MRNRKILPKLFLLAGLLTGNFSFAQNLTVTNVSSPQNLAKTNCLNAQLKFDIGIQHKVSNGARLYKYFISNGSQVLDSGVKQGYVSNQNAYLRCYTFALGTKGNYSLTFSIQDVLNPTHAGSKTLATTVKVNDDCFHANLRAFVDLNNDCAAGDSTELSLPTAYFLKGKTGNLDTIEHIVSIQLNAGDSTEIEIDTALLRNFGFVLQCAGSNKIKFKQGMQPPLVHVPATPLKRFGFYNNNVTGHLEECGKKLNLWTVLRYFYPVQYGQLHNFELSIYDDSSRIERDTLTYTTDDMISGNHGQPGIQYTPIIPLKKRSSAYIKFVLRSLDTALSDTIILNGPFLKNTTHCDTLLADFVMDFDKNCIDNSNDSNAAFANWVIVKLKGHPGYEKFTQYYYRPTSPGAHYVLPDTGTYRFEFYNDPNEAKLDLEHCNQSGLTLPFHGNILIKNLIQPDKGIKFDIHPMYTSNPLCKSDSIVFGINYTDGDYHRSYLPLHFAVAVDWGQGVKDSFVYQAPLPSMNSVYTIPVSKFMNKSGVFKPKVKVYSLQGSRRMAYVNMTDSITIADSCQGVSGRIYRDENTNCSFDGNDVPLNGLVVQSTYGTKTLYAITDNNGSYVFDWPTGTQGTIAIDVVKYTAIGHASNCNTSGIHSNVNAGSSGNNFALACLEVKEIEAFYASSTWQRPGDYFTMSYFFSNMFCDSSSTTFTVALPAGLKYVDTGSKNMTPVYVSSTNDTLKFDLTIPRSFGKYNSDYWLNFSVKTDTFFQFGDTVSIDYRLDAIPGTDGGKLVKKMHVIIRNSYDPNDKQVLPHGDVDSTVKEFIYTIRFQNKGNAEALNVYILDTLDNNLDITTFHVIHSSHKMSTHFFENNVMKFDFRNINLPDDKSDEPGSHGKIIYSVKRKNGLTIGHSWKNTGYIYFDFNPPIITNTTVTTIIEAPTNTVAKIKVNNVSLYPNPVSDVIHLSCEDLIQNVRIMDLTGRILTDKNTSSFNPEVPVSLLAPGNYIIRIQTVQGIAIVKFVKL